MRINKKIRRRIRIWGKGKMARKKRRKNPLQPPMLGHGGR
jgi:hypothetical protein